MDDRLLAGHNSHGDQVQSNALSTHKSGLPAPEQNSIGPEAAQSRPSEGDKKTTGAPPQATSTSNPRPSEPNAEATMQERKHWLDYAGFFVGVLTLIVVFIYTTVAYYQWREMHRATKAAQDAANTAYSQIRPWIKISSVELRASSGPIKTLMFHWPMTQKVVPPMLQIKASVTNVGHTVAQGVQVLPELFFGQFDADTWHDAVTKEEARYCNSVNGRRPVGGDVATVFPSDSKIWYMGVGGTIPDVKNPASALIVCVNYGGTSQNSSQTQAWFGLYENGSVFINITSDADANSLKLIRDGSGDHAY